MFVETNFDELTWGKLKLHYRYSRIPAIRNPPIRNLALEILAFHAEIAVSLIADCIIDVKLRN